MRRDSNRDRRRGVTELMEPGLTDAAPRVSEPTDRVERTSRCDKPQGSRYAAVPGAGAPAFPIERWLRAMPPDVDGTLTREDVEADGTAERQQVLTALGRELRRNYLSREELAIVLQSLGADRLANHLRENKLPTRTTIRHGEFGEALSGALFRRVKRYCVPIMKLRYKQGRNQPTQLADILAFRLRADPPRVAVLEAKTRTTRDLGIGAEAYAQLTTTVRDGLGQAITFVVARLADVNPALAARIAALLDGRRVVESHVVLVYDDAKWDERVIERLRAAANEDVATTIIRLSDLAALVDASYTAAAEDLGHAS